MSNISTCPHCAQQVLISGELDPETLVRCPICEAEFPLVQALVNAVEAPPELVPVARVGDPPQDASAGVATPPVTGSAGGVENLASPSSPDVSTTGTRSPAVPAGAEGESRRAAPGRALDTAALVRAMEAEQGGPHDIYDVADPRAPAAAASELPTFSHAQTAALWRSRQRPASSLGSVGKALAIVVGGFLGIAVAYFFLSIISPRRFDFLHLWGRPQQSDTSGPASNSRNGTPAPAAPGKFDPDNPSFSDLDQKRSSGPKR
jgi:hypothetical protein